MKANTNEYPDFDRFNTFPKLLKHISEIMPDEVALRNKDLGIWNEITWDQYNKIVSELSIGLESIGFKKIVDEIKKILNLNGEIEFVNLDAIPNDGKVIDYIRDFGD